MENQQPSPLGLAFISLVLVGVVTWQQTRNPWIVGAAMASAALLLVALP